VISTEDPEIAEVSRQWGAEILWRPKELADDEASTLSVLQHAVTEIAADVVVVLQATSPIRNAGLIDQCIQRFLEAQADSLATGFVCKYQEYGTSELRRQDIKGFFYDDGNIYAIRAAMLRHGDRYGRRIETVILDKEQNLDIDDMFDFFVAEQILKRRHGLLS
jgi:CMP-N-acetylneuraminic acid synthetase